jgi:site-specific recombinase XerD
VARSRRQVPTSPLLLDMIPSWELALEAANKSPGTIRSYVDSVRALAAFLPAHSRAAEVEAVDADDVRAFLAAVRLGCWLDEDMKEPCPCGQAATSAGNAHKHFRNLRVFFNWLHDEQERTAPSPMANITPPKVASKPTTPLTDEELKALLKVCSGSSWIDRRDTAILRILMDNGMRVSGLAGLRYSPDDESDNDVLLARHMLRIRLKGGDIHMAPIGRKTAAAIDRYIRARARHPHASSPWLWLPAKGITAAGGDRRLTTSGIQQMLERRGEEAGVADVYAHRFRHTMADDYLKAGGDPLNLMRITGWKSIEMVRRYTEARAHERARAEHARLSPGDRL